MPLGLVPAAAPGSGKRGPEGKPAPAPDAPNARDPSKPSLRGRGLGSPDSWPIVIPI